jgi:Autophagy protein ATG17-like domain
LLASEVKELASLVETIQVPKPLPPITLSTDSLQQSKSTTRFTSYSEKQDYHVHHLAQLLTSLAQHYDQTSSALKDHETHLGDIPNIDTETLAILANDANEVHEVLEEMEHHVHEIELSSSTLQSHIDSIDDTYIGITATFAQLDQYGQVRLSAHLSSVKDFESRATSHKIHIQTLKQQMSNLVRYYTDFSISYGASLIEVRRRTEAHTHTALLVTEITAKLASLYEQEVKARQAFWNLHAPFLPADLWRGIEEPPTRYEVTKFEGGKLPVLAEGKRLSSASMEKRRSAAMLASSDSTSGRRSMDSSSGRRSGESSRRS